MTSGLICPHCTKDVKPIVLETRAHADGVARKRACGNCGKDFTTLEKVSVELVFRRNRQVKESLYSLREKRTKKNDLAVFTVWK